MDCSSCNHYNRGYGQRSCLKCKKYIDIMKQSVHRETIPYDHIPQAIYENIAENPQTRQVISILRSLPIEESTAFLMAFFLSATQEEIAKYMHISQSSVSRKINFTVEMIKKRIALNHISA